MHEFVFFRLQREFGQKIQPLENQRLNDELKYKLSPRNFAHCKSYNYRL